MYIDCKHIYKSLIQRCLCLQRIIPRFDVFKVCIFAMKYVRRFLNQQQQQICYHLWYHTEETVALRFFDDAFPVEPKVKMAKVFKEKESHN